jgi:hypothetical protein
MSIISDVNQQVMTITGRTRDELIGAPCRNLFTDPVRADAAIKRVLTENNNTGLCGSARMAAVRRLPWPGGCGRT